VIILSAPSVQKWCRVVATIHDCDGRLVTYSLSAFAYSVKSHPRNIKRPLQASTDDSEDAGGSRFKRRRAGSTLVTTSTTSTAGNHASPPNTSAAGASNQQQFGRSVNTGGPPIVAPTVDRSIGTPKPIVDPRSQSFLHETRGLSSLDPNEGSQPIPTLDEVVPPSCNWRGGIAVSLFVNNLPQDGPIYARFGGIVVRTVGVPYNSLRFAYRPNSGSEDPPCAGMHGPIGARSGRG